MFSKAKISALVLGAASTVGAVEIPSSAPASGSLPSRYPGQDPASFIDHLPSHIPVGPGPSQFGITTPQLRYEDLAPGQLRETNVTRNISIELDDRDRLMIAPSFVPISPSKTWDILLQDRKVFVTADGKKTQLPQTLAASLTGKSALHIAVEDAEVFLASQRSPQDVKKLLSSAKELAVLPPAVRDALIDDLNLLHKNTRGIFSPSFVIPVHSRPPLLPGVTADNGAYSENLPMKMWYAFQGMNEALAGNLGLGALDFSRFSELTDASFVQTAIIAPQYTEKATYSLTLIEGGILIALAGAFGYRNRHHIGGLFSHGKTGFDPILKKSSDGRED